MGALAPLLGPELAPGSLFAGHRIEGVIGRGGMGVVYRARQLELDRLVALKIIAPELLGDIVARERFLREARAAASVDHPNVIPLHYAGEHEGIAYLAMRYVDGDDVRSLVRREGPLAAQRAAKIVARVGAALDAIHAAGFVHRDIKPANVMIAEDDHVYVTDFGLAKRFLTSDDSTRTGHFVGSLDYAAPEQIREGRADARSDVYGLGGVLFFMLTGRIPFQRDSREAKLLAHLAADPPVPSRVMHGLPPELDAVVARAMAKSPDDRYRSAGDLGRAAVAAASGSSVPLAERSVARGAAADATIALDRDGSTLSATRRIAPPGPERRALGRLKWAVAALAALSVAAGAVLVLSRDGEDPVAPVRTQAQQAAQPSAPAITVGATIQGVGRRPNAVAVAGGDVWVGSFALETLTRVDAKTARRTGKLRVGTGVNALAGDERSLWVAVNDRRLLMQVDARKGRVVRRIDTPGRAFDVQLAARDLWVSMRIPEGGPDRVVRYDPRTGREVGSISAPGGASALALTPGAVWVANRFTASVSKYEVRTGLRTHLVRLPAQATDLVAGAGYVWATLTSDDSVARIDPRTGDVVMIAAPRRPRRLTVAGGRVLVAGHTEHTVAVIDARTARPVGRPLAVGLNPLAMAAGDGHVWVTGVGTGSLTRIDVPETG